MSPVVPNSFIFYTFNYFFLLPSFKSVCLYLTFDLLLLLHKVTIRFLCTCLLFAPGIFYSSNTNHQRQIDEHLMFANYFVDKSIFILYISWMYLLKLIFWMGNLHFNIRMLWEKWQLIIIKKTHTFDESGVQLRTSFWNILMELKNKYLLKKLKWPNKKQNSFDIYNAALKKKIKIKTNWVIFHVRLSLNSVLCCC